jgi:hypothetical protein
MSLLNHRAFRLSLIVITGLVLMLLVAPRLAFAQDDGTCGDGVCDPTRENSDLCKLDCACDDNGWAEAFEGCGCRDKVCAGEDIRDRCGVVAKLGTCEEPFMEHEGVCWNAEICQWEAPNTPDDSDDTQRRGGPTYAMGIPSQFTDGQNDRESGRAGGLGPIIAAIAAFFSIALIGYEAIRYTRRNPEVRADLTKKLPRLLTQILLGMFRVN